MLTLYQYSGKQGLPSLSPPCAKVHLALRLHGLEHEVKDIEPPEVKRYSPTGRVPALKLDGQILVDSVRILDALEALPQARPLAPSDPLERARDRLWEHLANDTLYWCLVVGRWLVPKNLDLALGGLVGEGRSLERTLTRLVAPRLVGKRAKGQGMGLKPYEDVVADFRRGVELVADVLGDEGFLEGRPRPGRGDLALATLFSQVGWRNALPRMHAILREHPRVRAHTLRTYEACDWEAPRWVQE